MKPFHSIYLGCETGLIKGVDVEHRTWSNVTSVEQADRQNEILRMCWNDEDQNELCFGRRSQTVSIFDTHTNAVVNTLELAAGNGAFKGLCKVNSDYITCTECGCLRLWSSSGTQKLEISAGENVYCMRNNPQQRHLVATGGKENRLKVWNLERPETPIFTAKNVRHDWLNLRQPEWVTDVAFLPDSQQVITSTNDHQVRVYDPSSDCRRPVVTVVFDECPITSMCLRPSEPHHVFVGNAHGNMALIDLRGKGKVVQQYKGAEGGIRSVDCHPMQNMVASCGLDRYLRLYDIDSRKLIHKFYVKSRVNAMLFSSKQRPTNEANVSEEVLMEEEDMINAENEPEEATGEDEALWSKMVPVEKAESTKHAGTKRRGEAKSCTPAASDKKKCTSDKMGKKKMKKIGKMAAATE